MFMLYHCRKNSGAETLKASEMCGDIVNAKRFLISALFQRLNTETLIIYFVMLREFLDLRRKDFP